MRGRGGQKRQHIFRRFRIILDSFGTFCPKCPVLSVCPVLSRVPGLRGGQTQKGAMVTMVALLFGNKSAMVRPMVRLWSLWSVVPFVQFWPNGPFWLCPGAPGAKTQKSAMVTMVALLFGNKVLWSGLWSGYGRYGQVGAFWENEVTIATIA